jgi:molybdopterin molybdotransferase
MISVQEAFAILQANLPLPQTVVYPLVQARKHVLAASVYSPINMPPFRQSSMDGYALCLHESLAYECIGEVKAGDAHEIALVPGQAVKIFTGAAVPDTAQAVVQIEIVKRMESTVQLDKQPVIGMNVRPIGEQIASGDVALEKGTVLHAAAIGFLASLGFTSVKVYSKPKVGIVVTGNELVQPGTPLTHGKVYESNGSMLQSALYDAFYSEVNLYAVNDDFENTKKELEKALFANDVVLVSGGISVGDYDFVAQALSELEVETIFYKVNQKPGKPLFAGKQKEKMVFALPGNPAACLSCFYVYVLPTLSILSGKAVDYNQATLVSLAHDYVVNNSRAQFLKASVVDDEVHVLSHQASSMLNSFSVANGLLFVEDGNYELKKGVKVPVYFL